MGFIIEGYGTCKYYLLCLAILSYFRTSETTCTLPASLQNSQWTFTSSTRSFVVTTDTNTFSTTGPDWVNAQGDALNRFECFTNLSVSNNETIVVLKSTSGYSDEGNTRFVYMCMKVTEVTANLHYFYLFSNLDSSVSPAQRIFSPAFGSPTLTDNDPVCDTFCIYTETIPDSEFITLKKDGTNDNLPSNISLCECDKSCIDKVCPQLPHVEHATNITTGYSPGDVVVYTCDTGYELTSGSLNRTCKNDETWDETSPSCSAVSCPSLATVPHSTNQQTGSSYIDTVTYTCDTGYELTSGFLTRSCRSDKQWSGSPPVCAPVSCPSLGTVAHSSNQQTGSSYSDTVTYTCNTGYELTSGDLQRTCQSNKQWSGRLPVCTKVTCPNLATVLHSSNQQTGSSYSDMVTYICDTGYELTSGFLTRTCQSDKQWSGSQPVCTLVFCPNVETVAYSMKQQTGSNYKDTVTYTCYTGYELTSGDLQRTCQSNKQWSGNSPVCRKEPTAANAKGNLIIASTLAGIFLILAIVTVVVGAFCIISRRKRQRKQPKTIRKKKHEKGHLQPPFVYY